MLPAGILSIGVVAASIALYRPGYLKQCLLFGRSYLPSNFAGVGLELSQRFFVLLVVVFFFRQAYRSHLVQYGPQDDGGFWRWGRFRIRSLLIRDQHHRFGTFHLLALLLFACGFWFRGSCQPFL